MKKYHLVASIDVLRHGEKDQKGQLTADGFYQSAMKAINIQHLSGDVHVYHSGNNRVMKTVSTIHNLLNKDAEYLHNDNFGKDINDHAEGTKELFEIDDHIDNRLHFLNDPKNKGKYFSTWGPEPDVRKRNQRTQDFLNLDDISPEAGITDSPKKIAQNALSLVAEQIESVLSTKYHIRENFINGTHEPVVMSAIFYFLNYFKFGKNDFVEHVGGSVDYTEGFHIKIFQRRNGEHLLQFYFRDYMIDFRLEELKDFINS
ncbi:MAG: hypothetical protein LR005_00160 [Candidatus Pacebacteria bacterium]|nr:hypothetical protein [Candidatus Paceibacterota bacterium]